MFHVYLNFGAVYGVGVCVNVCGVVCVVVCVVVCFLCLGVVGGVPLWIVCVFRRVDVVFVSVVLQVVILSAVLCVICSLLMFVSDASGDHMVETYCAVACLGMCRLWWCECVSCLS